MTTQAKTAHTICIIDGVARSGTTFTSAVISSLPNTFIFKTASKFPAYYHHMHGRFGHPYNLTQIRRMRRMDLSEAIPSFDSYATAYVQQSLGYLKDENKERAILERVKEKAKGLASISYVQAFEMFHDAAAEILNVGIIGGKITFCHNFKEIMLAGIPRLKWIDVVRDVRAVYTSGQIGHYKMNSMNMHDFWREQVDSVERFRLSDFPDRHLLIRYEDMILHKEATVRKIASFLEIDSFDYHQWAKQPILGDSGKPFGTHSSFNEEGKLLENFYYREGKEFDTKPVNRWDAHLSDSQKWLLTSLYRDELAYLNYPINKYKVSNPLYLWIYLKRVVGYWLKRIICKIRNI